MNYLKKLIHDSYHYFKPNRGGWVEDIPDKRDYKFGTYFAPEIFGATLPTLFSWKNEELPTISFQDSTFSCVCNSFSFINAFNSKREGNDVFLSWRYLYALVPQMSGGTSFRDNGEQLRKGGQTLNSEMPENEYYLAMNQRAEKNRITSAMREHALTYRIKNYFYIDTYNKTELKTAIMKAPVVIGIYSNSNQWNNEIIKYDGYRQFGHAIVIIGWSPTYWLIVDWMNPNWQIRKLDINHPIASAIVVVDMPDTSIDKIMMKTYKSENKPEIYLLKHNGTLQHLSSFEQYKKGIDTQTWLPYTLKSETEMAEIFNMYKIDNSQPLVFNL